MHICLGFVKNKMRLARSFVNGNAVMQMEVGSDGQRFTVRGFFLSTWVTVAIHGSITSREFPVADSE
jgi:hypothetical protein